jgi:hypothetical protein
MSTQSKPGDIIVELNKAKLGVLVLNNKNYNLAELSDRFAAIHREVTDEYLASWSGRAAPNTTAAPRASAAPARRSTISSIAPSNVAAAVRRMSGVTLGAVANVTPARRRTAGNAAASRPFSDGQRVRLVDDSNRNGILGTVVRLRDDEDARNRWATGGGYYYSVQYDDGKSEAYEAHSDLEPE